MDLPSAASSQGSKDPRSPNSSAYLIALPRRSRLIGLVAFLALLFFFRDHVLPHQAWEDSLDAIQRCTTRPLQRRRPPFPQQRGLVFAVDEETVEHPISRLMRQAERSWDAKVARQSKTLEQVSVVCRHRT